MSLSNSQAYTLHKDRLTLHLVLTVAADNRLLSVIAMLPLNVQALLDGTDLDPRAS